MANDGLFVFANASTSMDATSLAEPVKISSVPSTTFLAVLNLDILLNYILFFLLFFIIVVSASSFSFQNGYFSYFLFSIWR